MRPPEPASPRFSRPRPLVFGSAKQRLRNVCVSNPQKFIQETLQSSVEDIIRCPICLVTPLNAQNMCPRCKRTFVADTTFTDLTLNSGGLYSPPEKWGGTELFRSPLVSFIYERGWRQGFAWAGFPGVDEEFRMAMSRLEDSVPEGQVLVDLSCGSGLFTRRFIDSKRFSSVIAVDYSENMLRQTKSFLEEGKWIDPTSFVLLRADVARLPFATGSVPAIHAGAALHCWPDPLAALAEVSRVLAPGGVFIASTFLSFSAPLGQLLGSDALTAPLDALDPVSARSNYRWWREQDIKDLCATVGLTEFERERQGRFILFSVKRDGS